MDPPCWLASSARSTLPAAHAHDFSSEKEVDIPKEPLN
jgi:hypothetical protein